MGTHDRPTRRPRRYEDDYEYGDDYEYEEEEYEDHSHEEDAEEDHDTRGRGGRGSAGLAKSPGGILDTPRVLDLPLPALGGDGEGGGQGEGLGGAVPPLFSSGGVSPALLRSPMRLFEGFGGKTPRGLQGAGSPMDIDGVLGMLYSPAAPGTGRGDGGRPTLSPLGRPSSGPKEEGLTVVGVGAKRAIEAYVKASPRPDLLRGGIPVPGNTGACGGRGRRRDAATAGCGLRGVRCRVWDAACGVRRCVTMCLGPVPQPTSRRPTSRARGRSS